MKRVVVVVFFFFFLSLNVFSQDVKPTASPTPIPTPKQADDDVVKISTTLIQVDVTVTDRNGNIVTDLKPEDFEVFENNKKQNITNFSFVSAAPNASPSPAETPKKSNDTKNSIPPPPPTMLRPDQVRRTIALVVDDLTLSFESTAYTIRALKKFVDEQMQEGDLVAIVRTGGGIGALQQFTSDKRQLYAAIDKIRWNPAGNGKIAAFAPIEPTAAEQAKANGITVSDEDLENERNFNQSTDDFRGSIFATGTLGALNYIIRGMRELPGRKSVMLMSDGFKLFVKDQSGFMESASILESLKRLTDLANRASVVIYTLDARGLQTLSLSAADNTSELSSDQIEQRLSDRKTELFDTQQGLVYLAQQTGGFAIINNNDLPGSVKKVLNDQNGYYLLGYAPDEETFDAKTRRFNKLNIKLKRPDLKVRYRSGFFGVADEEVKPTQQTKQQQLVTALTSPFATNGIELRLNTLFGSDVKNGSFVRSLIHINANDLKFEDEPDGSHKTTFEVLAMSFGANGAVVDQLSRSYTLSLKKDAFEDFLSSGFVYNFVFPVKKPGAYQLRVALQDSSTGKVGSANQFVEVPDIKKGFLTLSGLVLENMTFKEYQDSQSSTAPPQDPAEARSSMRGDTSLRRFKNGTVLRYGLEVYNAKPGTNQQPQLTSQTRVFRDGKLLYAGKQQPVELSQVKDLQKLPVVGAINLGSVMTPGDYVLQVVVTDNMAKDKRKIATQFVQFEIIQ